MSLAAPPRAAATPARAWLRALQVTDEATRDPSRTLALAVNHWAERYGDAPALISERETYSFRALAARANAYSRWALAAGHAKGDVVALMMSNRPEYFALWLGLTQVGVVVALLNVNLTGAALAHCVRVAGARAAIVEAPFTEVCAAAFADLLLDVWRHGGEGDDVTRVGVARARLGGAARRRGAARD